MLFFLVGLQILIAVSLIIIVLIQQGKGAEAGAALSSGSQSLLGTSTGGSTITRITSILAAAFIINSLVMATLSSQNDRASGSVVIEADEVPNSQESDSDLPNIPLPQ
jgi:preprotein translocase subunit SecG